MHCARQLQGHCEGIGDFTIFEAVALGPLTRKPQVQRCGSERHRGHASAQDLAYRPTHVLAVFDLLAKNDLDDGGRR